MKKFITALVLSLTASISHASTNMNILFSQEGEPEAWCLAQNIYYEARGSNLADQVAVADVVLNRVQDTRYPNTICEVVQQGIQKPSWKDPSKMVMVRHKCQFSWYCDGKADVPKDKDAWANAQQRAYMMIVHGDYRGISQGATHYHAKYVSPEWSRDFDLVGRIGVHIFYRWDR